MSKYKRFTTVTRERGCCYGVLDREFGVLVSDFWFYAGEAQTPYTRARMFAKMLNEKVKGA